MTISEIAVDGTKSVRDLTVAYNATVDELTGDNAMSFQRYAAALADDGTSELPDATYGQIMATCGTEWFFANVAEDGTITLLIYSDEVDDANTDGKFCLYASGTQAIVKNRLGSTQKVTYLYSYYTP